MKMLSVSPVDVGVYSGETETNLGESMRVSVRALQSIPDDHSLVEDGPEEFETGLDLGLRVFGFDYRADDRDVHILGADVVGGRNHSDVNI